ncbi:MAG: type II secretion system F family protein [Planctomycetota bacterium]
MAQFAYTAIDPSGEQKTGRVAAEDRGAAISSVEALGLMPVSIEVDAGASSPAVPGSAGRFSLGGRKVSQAQSLAFVRQLGNLLAAGVPLARALQILGKESSNPVAARQCAEIRDQVVDGLPLADAMARFPRSFPPIYVAMIRAGETGGFLEVVLKQIADFMSRERDLKSKVSTALVYPAVLAFIATGVVIFLLAWFIPRFSEIFDEFGQSLPLLTRIIQAASMIVLNYGLFVLIGAVLLAVVIRRALTTPAGRRGRDAYILRVPGVGTAAARFALVRFARMLGTLVGAGVPLLASLRVSREAVGNQTLSDALDEAIDDVQQGTALAASLSRCPRLFPGSVVEMIAVAEESGRLSEELVRMAGEFEEDLDRRLRTLVSLAEPALLFLMASIVGTIVIGMLLPVFDLWNAIE